MLKSRKTGQTNTHSNLKQIPETAMNCKGFYVFPFTMYMHGDFEIFWWKHLGESCAAFDLAFELG